VFENPLRAPPKASTHAMPLIEAMARGLPNAPSTGRVAFAATVPAPLGRAPKPSTPDPGKAAAPAVTQTLASPSTVQHAKPPSAERASAPVATISHGKRGARVAVAAAVSLAFVGGAWFVLRRPDVRAAPKVVAPAAPSGATVPPVAMPPVVMPRLAPEAPRATPPLTSAAPASPPTAQSKAAAPSEKRHRRNHRRPAAEQTADGVPIMP